MRNSLKLTVVAGACLLLVGALIVAMDAAAIGEEKSMNRQLADGEEFEIPIQELLLHGGRLFDAKWTIEEGGGRPLTKGTGAPIADPNDPLVFPRAFNRVSAPDANACGGCHNEPRSGGAGEIVANVFVLGQRFDFADFGGEDTTPTKGGVDENGDPVSLGTIANSRLTTGMFGAGYLEMLARQMTADLQLQRDGLAPGQSVDLIAKGITFGTLTRNADGTWDAEGVEGLAAPSVFTDEGARAPTLVVHPWHQASAVVSLRQFTNNAMNHHHGIQTTERFGDDTDPDGDGFVNEMTRADVTAVSVWQAALPVPGRVIPSYGPIEDAVLHGEEMFAQVGCNTCHVEALPLDDWGWFYSEPNPYNPAGNLQVGEYPDYIVNLNSKVLPQPRLGEDKNGITWVPAYTDMKLHDITSGPDDPNRESLNMHFPAGSDEFLAGNSRFLTKRLWGAANTPPYFHHGQFTTLRQAIEAHAGEAQAVTDAYLALDDYSQDSIIEFLKTLQVLPPGTRAHVIDEQGRPRQWPPRGR